jgi:hypothetical protein
MTANSAAMHHIRYDAPDASNFRIVSKRSDLYNAVGTFDKYLCRDCAKQVLKPFIDPVFFEGEE